MNYTNTQRYARTSRLVEAIDTKNSSPRIGRFYRFQRSTATSARASSTSTIAW